MASAANSTTSGDPNFDTITFTVITQVLPLLALFGQDLTNEYISLIISYYDYILFAVGPLGVGWAVIASVRALGPKWLQGRIGKFSERDALVERDLMPSTSEKVCELWDGEKVVREIRKGKIQEFLLLNGEIWKPDDGRTEHFDTDPARRLNSDYEAEKQIKTISSELSNSNGKDENSKDNTAKKQHRPPNLTLNLLPGNRERYSILATVIASFLQSGFLALMVTLKYDSFLSHHFPIPTYTFVFGLVGTVLLSLGLILTAYGLNCASTKVVWKRLPNNLSQAYILWVQRGLEDENGGKYSSYILVQAIRRDFGIPLPKIFHEEFIEWISVYCCCHLHNSRITLFAITLIMTGIRVMLRPAPRPLTQRQTHPLHEMDWLAVTQLLRPNDLINPENGNGQAPAWTVNGGQNWESPQEISTRIPKEPSSNSKDLIYLRNKIGRECRWRSPGREEAIVAAKIIVILAQELVSRDCRSVTCSIPVDLGPNLRAENFTFSVTENNAGVWEVNKWNLVSALSLWIFYDQENDRELIRDKDEMSIFFLGSADISHELDTYDPDRRFARLRKVRIAENEEGRRSYEKGPLPVNVKRNMIAGFQNEFALDPPSSYYNRHRATVQLDIDSRHGVDVGFEDTTRTVNGPDERDAAENGRSLSSIIFRKPKPKTPEREKKYAPAIVETMNIAKLYARHLVSAFMWAAARHFDDLETPIHDQKPRLRKVAAQIATLGLLDEEDALLMILPPIIERMRQRRKGVRQASGV